MARRQNPRTAGEARAQIAAEADEAAKQAEDLMSMTDKDMPNVRAYLKNIAERRRTRAATARKMQRRWNVDDTPVIGKE